MNHGGKIEPGACYRCEECGGVFIETATEEQVQAELDRDWSDHGDEDTVRLCDKCYHIAMDALREAGFI